MSRGGWTRCTPSWQPGDDATRCAHVEADAAQRKFSTSASGDVAGRAQAAVPAIGRTSPGSRRLRCCGWTVAAGGEGFRVEQAAVQRVDSEVRRSEVEAARRRPEEARRLEAAAVERVDEVRRSEAAAVLRGSSRGGWRGFGSSRLRCSGWMRCGGRRWRRRGRTEEARVGRRCVERVQDVRRVDTWPVERAAVQRLDDVARVEAAAVERVDESRRVEGFSVSRLRCSGG